MTSPIKPATSLPKLQVKFTKTELRALEQLLDSVSDHMAHTGSDIYNKDIKHANKLVNKMRTIVARCQGGGE